ncbi:MAG TPA: cytochrome c oxidase subunit 3 [Pyrinomonadaceae bacterium]|nr:cytochrome c oxidase subunit 3 [Pyrinomonadaceae bacterium]
MAATATGTDRTVHAGVGGGPRPRNGNGFHKNGEGDDVPFRFSPARYRIGVWAAIGSILMLFVALTSAYIVRSASSDDWRRIAMPKILWVSTALLIVSSITIELSRRSLKSRHDAAYSRWLLNTVVLGVGFVASQLIAWRQLVRQGVYMASNPYNSFFYLLTGAHGLHVLGGLGALAYLVLTTRRVAKSIDGELRRTGAADAVAIYWHFMDALWIGLFALLMFWK